MISKHKVTVISHRVQTMLGSGRNLCKSRNHKYIANTTGGKFSSKVLLSVVISCYQFLSSVVYDPTIVYITCQTQSSTINAIIIVALRFEDIISPCQFYQLLVWYQPFWILSPSTYDPVTSFIPYWNTKIPLLTGSASQTYRPSPSVASYPSLSLVIILFHQSSTFPSHPEPPAQVPRLHR